MAVMDGDIARLTAELVAANERFVETERMNRSLRKQLRDAQAVEKRMSAQVKSMRSTGSWRLTFPFRVVWRAIFWRRP